MKNKISRLFYILSLLLFLVVLLLLVFISIYLLLQSHLELAEAILIKVGKLDKKEIFLDRYLSEDKYVTLRILFILITILYGFFLLKYFTHIKKISGSLYQFFHTTNFLIISCREIWKRLYVSEKVLILILFFGILLVRLYYLFVIPLYNDEVFTWLYFVKPGLLTAISYYPGPNNHLLNSICANISDLFFTNDQLVLRLFPLLAFLSLIIFAFFYLCKRYSFLVAFCFVLFFSSFFNIFFYSIMGRGYSFIYLFFFVALVSVLEILSGNKVKFWKVFFIFSSVMGFYSIPVFIYPFSSLVAALVLSSIIRKDFNLFKLTIFISILVTVFTLILYSPVLFVSGLSSITGNSFVKSSEPSIFYSSFPFYLLQVLQYIWQSAWGLYFFIATVMIGLFILRLRKEPTFAFVILITFLIPVLLLLIQKVLPFVRIWDYLLIPISLLLSFIAEQILIKVHSVRWKLATLFLLLVMATRIFYYKLDAYVGKGFPYYSSLNRSLGLLFKKSFETVDVHEETYFLFVQYYAAKENRNLIVEWMKGDRKADVLILPSHSTFPKEYEVINENNYVSIGLKRGE